MELQLTARERMARALRGERPDVLPAAPAYLSLFLADWERAYYAEQYRRRLGSHGRCHIDHEQDTRIRAQAIYHSYGVLKVWPDWMEIHRGPSREWARRTDVVAEGGALFYEDRDTGRRTPLHAARSTTDVWDASASLRDSAAVDEQIPIRPAEELLSSGRFDLPRLVASEYGDRCLLTTILDTPFSDAYDLLGFQGLMLIQHDRPHLLHYLLARKLAQTREVMAAWAGAGIHAVYVEEVFTGADLISPRSYDQFVFAYNRPYFHHLRSMGLSAIHYVCGDVIPRLDRIAELEIDAVAVEESKKGFSIEIDDVVKRVDGRVSVLGNIDAVRFGLQAGLDDMAAEVRRQAAIGRQARGFVVSTGSPFPLDTNPRLLDTLVATAHSIPGGAEGSDGRGSSNRLCGCGVSTV